MAYRALQKLRAVPEYPYFIRHINGNTLDNDPQNLGWVTLEEAFKNISTWKVDWVIHLTPKEITQIRVGIEQMGYPKFALFLEHLDSEY